MVNVSIIDDAIRKVQAEKDAEIRKLEALKLVASDPRLVDMLIDMASKNGGRQGILIAAKAAPLSTQAKGALIRTAKAVCETFQGQFTAHDLIEQMKARGFAFVAAKPHIAINGILRKFIARGLVRLVDKGSGRIANRYEVIRQS